MNTKLIDIIMGCAVSTSADREAIARSKKIDRDLRADQLKQSKEVKLLLLGKLRQELSRMKCNYTNVIEMMKQMIASPDNVTHC